MRQTLVALVVGAAAVAASAQEAPQSPQPKETARDARFARIAVIDMQKVSGESLLGKAYAVRIETLKAEIDAERTKKQNDLQKLDAQLKALQEELEKQQAVLSPEAADRKRQEITRKTRERQAFLEDGQTEIQKMQERASAQAQSLNNEFQQKIRPIIEAVAKDKGIDILLDGQAALTVNRTFDISQDVVVKADDSERASKAKAPATGADKPAAPAPPKPSPAPTPKP